jgi:hypothetical protein
MSCGVALRLAYPLHRKSLSRTAHFGGEPAPQGFAASQGEGFPADRWLIQAARLRYMRLKMPIRYPSNAFEPHYEGSTVVWPGAGAGRGGGARA